MRTALVVAGAAGLAAATLAAGNTKTVAPAGAPVNVAGANVGFTGYCGVELNAKKDLLDGYQPTSPIDTAVQGLISLPAEGGTDVRSPTEHNVYRVTVTLKSMKVEADSDIHLVAADPQTGTDMIFEFPAASCLARSAAAPQIEAARAALVAAEGTPGSAGFTSLSGCAVLTGVAFFDRLHGQQGVAANGVELHPVLSFQPCGTAAPPPAATQIPVDNGPPVTAPVPTVPTVTAKTCKHYWRHVYRRKCRPYYFSTP